MLSKHTVICSLAASAAGIDTALSTKAPGLLSGIYGELIKSHVLVQVGLDYPNDQESKLGYHQALSAIEGAAKRGLRINVAVVATPTNVPHYTHLYADSGRAGAWAFRTMRWMPLSVSQMKIVPAAKHIRGANEALCRLECRSSGPKLLDLYVPPLDGTRHEYCASKYHIHIAWNGDAFPCKLLRASEGALLGNVRDVALSELWSRHKEWAIRNRGGQRNIFAPCDLCAQ